MKKRKAPHTATDSTSSTLSQSVSEAQQEPVQKKAKKSKSKKKAKRSEEDESLFDTEKGINTAFAFMDPMLMADYLAQKIEWAGGNDLSSVELGDLGVQGTSIYDTTSFQSPRTLDNMPSFIEEFAFTKDIMKAPKKEKGAPHTIIVAGGGMRAAGVVRTMRKFQSGDVKVAKCFAKHIKMEEAVKFLGSHKVGVAVGTPQRLIDLVDNGALKLSHLDQLLVDASHIDEKKRGVLDMKETLMPLCKWLNVRQFRESYTASPSEGEGKGDGQRPLRLMFY
ncbi:csm1-like protein [Zalerion maritima]|uniref:Csm1-like protein n=1 Tax=Zalerion maritima TaxID=339359 RepID=A0AAD5WPG4_9PEZI|nr:csm1-like protein [Zalerion maritima]